MNLKLTKDGKSLSYTVKRWNKLGASMTVSIEVPAGELPVKQGKYKLSLLDGDKELFSLPELTYQDFSFQGYVDEKDKAQVSVSDLIFSEVTA
jgi:hypothetical protein